MSWAINMGIVSLSGLILHMGLQGQDKIQDKLHTHHGIHVEAEEKRQSKSKLYYIITTNRAFEELQLIRITEQQTISLQ